ncbi:isocitrate lyase/phosphoenolpyruvate mutase family protein [Streptosporangium sp. NPDC000239]|uniref:isocitrate lyase/PEP mutase family protein n=1 Tax=Streptosporangium sp. NPDC000239 TaxID=3154248 RepID=UPI00331AB67D
MTTLRERAELFHSLHRGGTPLVLANVWDVAGARLVEEAGAGAVATTSAGVAWSLGAPDGDRLDRDRAIDLIARIAAAVDLPVTADIESGFADTPEGVAETVGRVIAAGAVGVNIEDALYGGDTPLRPVEEQCERLAAARRAAEEAGIPLYVNARTDVYLRQVGETPKERFEAAVERAEAYLAAGASGVFVPGVVDPETVAALTGAVAAPLNILVGPGAPTVAELAALGVARVSLGSSIVGAAYAVIWEATREVLASGTYTPLEGALDYGRLNAILGG